MLIPIETHRNVIFQGVGPDPLFPPRSAHGFSFTGNQLLCVNFNLKVLSHR